MIPNKITIPQLFQLQCRHLVPIFQRPYVWQENKQWLPLWEDISRKAFEVMNSTPHLQLTQPRRHFLGAVVVKSLPAIGLEYPATEVIDGQQRLTTLQVLLVALRDYVRKVEFRKVEHLLVVLTENPELSGAKYERYKVLPTTSDRPVFESLWRAGSPEELLRLHPPTRQKYARQDDPPPLLARAYMFFYRAIKTFAEDSSDVSPPLEPADVQRQIHARLEALVVALTQRVELVRIDLEQEDDPQVIFETLNARGEPLLPSDLVRNFLFLEASRQPESADKVTELYNAHWARFDTAPGRDFWKALVTQGRFTHPRIELFLFHFLTSFVEDPKEDIQVSYLFGAFQLWWRNPKLAPQPRSVKTEMHRFESYANMFQALFTDSDSTRLGLFAKRLRSLDTSTVYPLLLFLLVERAQEVKAERDGILEVLESYLVRRMVCGLTPKNYNRLFVKMILDLRKVDGAISRSTIEQLLLGLSGPTASWPTDEEFEKAWLNQPAYQVLRQPRTAMVLEALEATYYGANQERAAPPTGPFTIEHLLPQTPTATHWPLPVAEDADEQARANAATLRAVLTHTFGNLSLITAPLNSQLSNGPWEAKREKLTNESVLMLNRYFQANRVDDWSEERIRERGEALFSAALTIWPRPGAQ